MKTLIALLVTAALALTGCANGDHGHGDHAGGASEAVAILQARSGSSVSGSVRFATVPGGVRITASVSGLTPNAKHAIHIHEKGDCSAPDGSSAGGHYNPDGHPHGGPDAAERHAGDLGNLQADASGHAEYARTFDNISIAGDHNPVIGLSVIVHAGEDDLTTQPTGNAGGRIACGVIELGGHRGW